jgi:hypothetical protein
MAASPSPLPASLPDPSTPTLDDLVHRGDFIMVTVSAIATTDFHQKCGTPIFAPALPLAETLLSKTGAADGPVLSTLRTARDRAALDSDYPLSQS